MFPHIERSKVDRISPHPFKYTTKHLEFPCLYFRATQSLLKAVYPCLCISMERRRQDWRQPLKRNKYSTTGSCPWSYLTHCIKRLKKAEICETKIMQFNIKNIPAFLKACQLQKQNKNRGTWTWKLALIVAWFLIRVLSTTSSSWMHSLLSNKAGRWNMNVHLAMLVYNS